MTLCCVLTAIAAQAQNTTLENVAEEEDSMLNIVAYFCKGDTMEYTKHEKKLQVVKNDTTVKSDIQTDFMIVVTDSMNNGYRMKFIPTGLHINDKTEEKADRVLTEKLWELSKDTPAIFTTDEMGVVQSIENWKEIRDVINKGIDLVIESYYKEIPALDSVMPKKRMKSLLTLQFATENGIRKSYDELSSLFDLHGSALKIGITDKQYSSEGYPAHTVAECGLTVKEDENDLEGDYGIRSNTVTKITSEDLADIAGNILNSLSDSGIGNKVTEVMKDTLKTVLNDTTVITNFEYFGYFFNGWPKQIYTEKTVDMSGIAKVINIKDIYWTRRRFLVWEEDESEKMPKTTDL